MHAEEFTPSKKQAAQQDASARQGNCNASTNEDACSECCEGEGAYRFTVTQHGTTCVCVPNRSSF